MNEAQGAWNYLYLIVWQRKILRVLSTLQDNDQHNQGIKLTRDRARSIEECSRGGGLSLDSGGLGAFSEPVL